MCQGNEEEHLVYVATEGLDCLSAGVTIEAGEVL